MVLNIPPWVIKAFVFLCSEIFEETISPLSILNFLQITEFHFLILRTTEFQSRYQNKLEINDSLSIINKYFSTEEESRILCYILPNNSSVWSSEEENSKIKLEQ